MDNINESAIQKIYLYYKRSQPIIFSIASEKTPKEINMIREYNYNI